MQALTPADVQAALDRFGFGIRIRFFEDSTATSQLAAEAVGCELGQIAKSICFLVDDKPVVVVASGDQRVDDRKLAAHFNVSRKRIKVASAEQCLRLYGYAPGGVPPLAYRTPGVISLLDESLKRYEQIFAAGGAHNAIFPLTIAQLVVVTGGTFIDCKRDASAPNE